MQDQPCVDGSQLRSSTASMFAEGGQANLLARQRVKPRDGSPRRDDVRAAAPRSRRRSAVPSGPGVVTPPPATPNPPVVHRQKHLCTGLSPSYPQDLSTCRGKLILFIHSAGRVAKVISQQVAEPVGSDRLMSFSGVVRSHSMRNGRSAGSPPAYRPSVCRSFYPARSRPAQPVLRSPAATPLIVSSRARCSCGSSSRPSAASPGPRAGRPEGRRSGPGRRRARRSVRCQRAGRPRAARPRR